MAGGNGGAASLTEASSAALSSSSSGGAAGASEPAASSSAGGTSGGDSVGCAVSDTLICEDFEGTDLGAIPSGWTRHGEEISVADDRAHSGKHSLKMGAIPVWERRIYRSAKVLGSAHWGRVYYQVQLPVPDAFVHSTLVALTGTGPTYGASEYRVVDTVKQAVDTPDVGSLHQYLYNVQPESNDEFGREGPYDQSFDDQWHCAEYHIDASNQSYALYVDGELELSFEDGEGAYERSDIPDSFDELRVGWINYQEAPPGFTAWLDDLAFDVNRIGCMR